MVGSEVLIRGQVKTSRPVSNKLDFLVLRHENCSVQCVAKQSEETKVGANMIKYFKQLNHEALVEVIGVVSLPKEPLTGTRQQVEIQVRKLYCLAKSLPVLPLNVEDEADIRGSRLFHSPTACEFTGFDVEMEIHKDYSEVMDNVDKSLVSLLTKIMRCKKELEAIGKQYPFEPLKFLPNTLKLTYENGI